MRPLLQSQAVMKMQISIVILIIAKEGRGQKCVCGGVTL